jgi:hypothetical protein
MKCKCKFLRQPWARVLVLAGVAMGIALLVPALKAEEGGQTGRAVRLGYVEGPVRLSQDNQVLADNALANTPLFEGSQVVTSDDGRAEIQFEDGSVARLSPGTTLTLKVLRRQNGGSETEMVLEGGLAYFEMQAGNTADRMRVRFNGSVVTASGFTVLRINLDNPPGEVAVFSGNAHLERANALALDLHGGESVSLNRANLSAYNLEESIEPDSWDSWNADRDEALQAAYGAKTGATKSLVNNDNPAWADLDANGNWYNVPGQGYVWSPYEASGAGWDPYGNGNWMWTLSFGYIWVSGDPWGYMPFQCGAWNYYNQFGWGWAPGMGMGSCRPWWGGGGYGGNGGGWYSTIGKGPNGYRFPVRPHPRTGPHSPIARLLNGGGKSPVNPVVPVNRRPPGGLGGQPVRGRDTPVVVAGHVVQPLRPLAPHQQPIERNSSGFMNSRPAPVFQGPARTPDGTPRQSGFGQGNHPVYAPGNSHPVYTPAPHPVYTPGSRPSGGQPGAAPSSGHPYSGGGSSGGHPSGGNSGGGGGSSHSSSGGGGGGSSAGGGGGGGSHGGGGGGGGGGGPHH